MNLALILAGGAGSRMKSRTPKQFLPLKGRTVLLRTIDAFETHPEIGKIVVVCPKEWLGPAREMIAKEKYQKVEGIIEGGETRTESARHGIDVFSARFLKDSIVLIHDGARPLVSGKLISECIRCASEFGACAAAIPVTDTIYESKQDGTVLKIPERDRLFAAQTPQAFRLSLIEKAYGEIGAECFTDDTGAALLANIPVHLVPGDQNNLKLTTPEDFLAAETYLKTMGE